MARPALLGFLGDVKISGMGNFWTLDLHEVPPAPGAYVLYARSGVTFQYPNGKSPVYYIGMAKSSLRNRLFQHLRYAQQASYDRRWTMYWPRYEYAAKFGGRYAFIRTWQRMTPRALEEEILKRFAERYRAFPVGNGAGAWGRIAQ